MQKSHKYCEVWISFLDIHGSVETINFCINTASEHKAASIAKEIAKDHGGTYSGRVQKRTK